MAETAANRSPTASETARRRRSRLMSTGSVVSVAAAGISAADDHNISNTEAMVHLIKATVGGGCLAMPDAFRNVGWAMGVVGTAVIGMSVLNMMSSIVRLSQALRSGKYAAAILADRNGNVDEDDKNEKHLPSKDRHCADELLLPPMDYPDTVAAVFQYGARGRFAHWAPFVRNFCSAALVTTYYGVNIIYVCIVAGTCKQLVDQYTADGAEDSWARSLHGRSIRWYPAVTALLIIPVGMVRLMKYLVPFSVAANACLVTGVSVVFYFVFAGDKSALEPEERAKMLAWPATRWSLFAGSTLCSLESIGMLLHIENAMRHPMELAGPPAYTLHKAMVVIVVFNGALGLFGYLRYGERCAGSISLSLPSNNRLAEVIKIMIALGILLTYGLQLTVTADLAWQGLRSRLVKNGAGHEKNADGGEELSPRLTAYYYGMRFALILGTILVATAIPDIGPLVSLIGSVGFSSLGLMVPVLMETVWYWYPKEDDGDDDDEAGRDHSGDATGEENGRAVFTVDGVAVSTNGGGGVPMSANGCGGVPMSANGCGGEERRKGTTTMTTIGRRRALRRAMRHVKNVALFALALFAMVGGAYFNVRDIVALAKGDSEPSAE